MKGSCAVPDYSALLSGIDFEQIAAAIIAGSAVITGVVLLERGIRYIRYVIWLNGMNRAGSDWGEARKRRARERGF